MKKYDKQLDDWIHKEHMFLFIELLKFMSM